MTATPDELIRLIETVLTEYRGHTKLDVVRADPDQHPSALHIFNREAQKVGAIVVKMGEPR